MVERITQLEKDILEVRAEFSDCNRRVSRVERVVKSSNIEELSKRIDNITTTLTGIDGKNGMQKSMNRVLILIDGDERYNVTGIVKQMEQIKKEVDGLVQQWNRIKWTVAGMGVVTTVGSLPDIIQLIKSIFFQ